MEVGIPDGIDRSLGDFADFRRECGEFIERHQSGDCRNGIGLGEGFQYGCPLSGEFYAFGEKLGALSFLNGCEIVEPVAEFAIEMFHNRVFLRDFPVAGLIPAVIPVSSPLGIRKKATATKIPSGNMMERELINSL